jgi:hypothetical protein
MIANEAVVETRSTNRDVLSFRYVVYALFFLIFYHAIVYLGHHAEMGDLVGMTLARYLLFGIICVALTIRLAISTFQLRFRTAISTLFGCLILSVLLPFGPLLQRVSFETIDTTRFFLRESHYTRIVEQLPSDSGPKLIVFNWGAGGAFGGGVFYVLAYDESGEIALPADARSQSWKARASKQPYLSIVDDCKSDVRRIKSHFYLVSTNC